MFHVGEIIWGYVRGYPWWPGRVVSPNTTQLTRLSIHRIPAEHRLVWFFNDNDKYTLVHVKNLRPFCDQQITSQTKTRKGKVAARLNIAFEQAAAAYRHPNDLDDKQTVDALVVLPSNQTPNSTITKPSHLSSSPNEEKFPSKQLTNQKRSHPVIPSKGASQTRPKSLRQTMSHKRTRSIGRTAGDAESDRLSTHCNPSPCDRSSQETDIDSDSNVPNAKNVPPRSILLRLRVREERVDVANLNDQIRPDSASRRTTRREQKARTSPTRERLRKKEDHGSVAPRVLTSHSAEQRSCESSSGDDDKNPHGDGKNSSRKGTKRNLSDLPPHHPRNSQHNGVNVAKRRRTIVGEKEVPDSKKPRSSDVRLPHSVKKGIDVQSESEDTAVARSIRPVLESKPSTEVIKIAELDSARLSDVPVRRSRRMRRISSRVAGTGVGSAEESDDDSRRPVASKRSRGTEAPRMSDGQRRLHVRRKSDKKPNPDVGSKGNNEDGVPRCVQALDEEMVPNGELEEENKFFRDLSKFECIQIIAKLRETIRKKNVQLWLRGRKLVEAQEVLRTEEGLIKACEPGVAKAEKLLRWAKKHEGYDKGMGSQFAKMEAKAVEGCEVLADVYFDRRNVVLNKIGPRILKLTKELNLHSQRVTEMLLELLLLWADLTSDSRKKEARIKPHS